MGSKIDISSTALEKGIDAARDFLERLVGPATDEVGLLLRDSVALWKLKNQVRVLNKAKAYCEANGIEPGTVSLKLLCPLIENAALEEDDSLQEKWAVLLSNLIDSEQNIQNHVFPYILSQISVNEFGFLETVYATKKARVAALSDELAEFRAQRPALEEELNRQLGELAKVIEAASADPKTRYSGETYKLQADKRQVEQRLQSLRFQENHLLRRIAAPEFLPDEGIREYEQANIVRLGLARAVHETYANSQTLEIPIRDAGDYLTFDLNVDIESESGHVLTELGELFVAVCTEKRYQD